MSVAQLAGGALTYSQSGVAFASSAAPVSTGVFAGLGGTTVTLTDLSFAAPGQIATFEAAPGLSITATALPGSFSSALCGAPPAAGQSCTPQFGGVSPLSLYNTANGSVAAVSVALEVQAGEQRYLGAGIITMQFTEPYQQVLATIAAGGQVASSFSAQFDAGAGGSMSFGGGANLGSGGIDLASQSLLGGLADGQFRLDPTSTGLFAPIESTLGSAADLAVIPDFLVFLADPSLAIDVTAIEAGAFSAANCFLVPPAGQTCTLPGASFEFANVANGSVLSFSLDGVLTTTGGSTPSGAVYSTQFVGRSYQQVLAASLSGMGSTGVYSASVISMTTPTPVPEPLSALLLGVGALVAWSRRRD